MDGFAVVALRALGGIFEEFFDLSVERVIEVGGDVVVRELIFDGRLDDQVCHGNSIQYLVLIAIGSDGGNRPVALSRFSAKLTVPHRVRNRIERWMQELKRHIDTFYASFSGNDVVTTNNWLRQFGWVWNGCLS